MTTSAGGKAGGSTPRAGRTGRASTGCWPAEPGHADLGQRLDIRPTAALVLCEWDRENVCARQPTSTMAGAAWDNSARRGDWSEAAAQCFVERAAHLELALHGVGHEHWDEGVMTRAEWYGRPASKWAWSDLLGHLDVYRAILDQHGLGPAAGHSFPQHFIPAPSVTSGTKPTRPTPVRWCPVRASGTSPRRSAPSTAGRRSSLRTAGSTTGCWSSTAARTACRGTPATACRPPCRASRRRSLPAPSTPSRGEAVALTRMRWTSCWRGGCWATRTDPRRLAAGHLRVLADAVRLRRRARGRPRPLVVEAGRTALDDALRAYDGCGLELDTFAETGIRRTLAQTVAAAQLAAALPAGRARRAASASTAVLLRLDPVENHLAVDRWVAFLTGSARSRGSC